MPIHCTYQLSYIYQQHYPSQASILTSLSSHYKYEDQINLKFIIKKWIFIFYPQILRYSKSSRSLKSFKSGTQW